MVIIISEFNVKTNGLEFVVTAKDWYNAIQIAYEEYVSNTEVEKRISYMDFRDYCRVLSCDMGK